MERGKMRNDQWCNAKEPGTFMAKSDVEQAKQDGNFEPSERMSLKTEPVNINESTPGKSTLFTGGLFLQSRLIRCLSEDRAAEKSYPESLAHICIGSVLTVPTASIALRRPAVKIGVPPRELNGQYVALRIGLKSRLDAVAGTTSRQVGRIASSYAALREGGNGIVAKSEQEVRIRKVELWNEDDRTIGVADVRDAIRTDARRRRGEPTNQTKNGRRVRWGHTETRGRPAGIPTIRDGRTITGNPQTYEEGMRLAKEFGASQVRGHIGLDANRRNNYHGPMSLPDRGGRQQGNTWKDKESSNPGQFESLIHTIGVASIVLHGLQDRRRESNNPLVEIASSLKLEVSGTIPLTPGIASTGCEPTACRTPHGHSKTRTHRSLDVNAALVPHAPRRVPLGPLKRPTHQLSDVLSRTVGLNPERGGRKLNRPPTLQEFHGKYPARDAHLGKSHRSTCVLTHPLVQQSTARNPRRLDPERGGSQSSTQHFLDNYPVLPSTPYCLGPQAPEDRCPIGVGAICWSFRLLMDYEQAGTREVNPDGNTSTDEVQPNFVGTPW
ncbi:hypothetical protein R1flu_028593 [Riccia fluitans]|uniref:Uncharacterized protein n=1 Tax=Riccia fluitans TaxID=41844 RepID=A0ABD1XM83_9MARC